MPELIDLPATLRGISILYWLVAVGAIVLALRMSKTPRIRIAGVIVVLGVFGYLPAVEWVEASKREALRREARAYFEKKCETEAGEKIYKTFAGVRSVLVVKPLPPASEKDNFDQFWNGDPYSAAAGHDRGEYAATRLVMDRQSRNNEGVQRGLDFVEFPNSAGEGHTRIHRPVAHDKLALREQIDRPTSRFGVAWEDISTPEGRKFWIAGSRFSVIDLDDNSVVAERIGFLIEPGFGLKGGMRSPWLIARGFGPNRNSCPPATDTTDQWFITTVFPQERQ